jgi:hypothetical protein
MFSKNNWLFWFWGSDPWVRLTPNPSPKERGLKKSAGNVLKEGLQSERNRKVLSFAED